MESLDSPWAFAIGMVRSPYDSDDDDEEDDDSSSSSDDAPSIDAIDGESDSLWNNDEIVQFFF